MKNKIDNNKFFQLITCASGIGAEYPECGVGPDVILQSQQFADILKNDHYELQHILDIRNNQQTKKLEAIPEIVRLDNELANTVKQLVQKQAFFTVLGGDHSCAMGTWSGVASALAKPFGLLWIDAHLDSHDNNSSSSSNVHGMPVATLLGKGDSRLTNIGLVNPSIRPENIVLFGVRSYEPTELALLNNLGVKIIFMDEIIKNGLKLSLALALEFLQEKTEYLGISIDMDAFDPIDIPGVGSPEVKGIRFDEFYPLYDNYMQTLPNLIGIEICEFNPTRDKNEKSLSAIVKLLSSLLKKKLDSASNIAIKT